MSFTTLALTGDRVLVKGTDSQGTTGETVLDGSEWAEIQRRRQLTKAHADFDSVVEDFFAPIIAAQEALNVEHDGKVDDPSSYVVFDEGQEATPGRRPVVSLLSKDSIVLRLLEEGHDDRLVWVNDELEVLAVLPGTADVAVAGTETVDA